MMIEKMIDLSLTMSNDLPIFPGDPEPNIHAATTLKADGYNTTNLHIGSHTGTHVDAPRHFNANGETIDISSLSNFIEEGVVLDVTGKGDGEAITLEDVAPYMEHLGKGKIAMFHTGWTAYLNNEKYYKHPYIETEVIDKMLDLGVRTFLIDALNIDNPNSDAFPLHDMITKVNGIIGENFTNFGDIDFEDPMIITLPLKILEGDGSPVRAVALKLKVNA